MAAARRGGCMRCCQASGILTLYSTTIQHKNLDFKNCNKTVEEADLQLSMINVGSVQEKIENAAQLKT